jgi:hypothetical protein
MEEFYEQYNGKDYGHFQSIMNSIEYASLILVAVYILGFRTLLIGSFVFLIYVGIVYFNRKKFVAYEYELTLDSLVISKVMTEKRRKKLLEFNLSDVESVSTNKIIEKKCPVINAYMKGKNNQYVYVKTPEGLKCLVLNMDEKLISMCYKIKPSVFRGLM